MKTNNKKKIVVSTLALAMGAALAGSISGSVAWYQYSTRATAAFIGSSAHCTENLQISTDGSTWKSDLTSSMIIAAATEHNGSTFRPATPGVDITPSSASDAAAFSDLAFKSNPVAHYFPYSQWNASGDNDYLQFDLYFRVLDVDGDSAHVNTLAKKLYFTDVTIEGHSKATDPDPVTGANFQNAVRILIEDHATGGKNRLFSKEGGDTNLYGALDLDNDGANETYAKYEWDEVPASGSKAEGIYGADIDDSGTLKAADTSTEYVEKTLALSTYTANDANASLDVTGATELGTTTGGADVTAANHLHYTFTIWLEGWDVDGTSSIWDVADYIGDFHIGFSFGVKAHDDGHTA